MHDAFRKTLLAAAGIILATVPAAGCSGEVSFTTASLSDATMALGVDEDARPVNPTNEFEVDTPEIFCSVELSNAPHDTEVTAEWIYVEGEVADVTNHVIDSYTLVTDGNRHLTFSIERPDNGWPVGDYRLVLYVDGTEETSVDFTVTGPDAQPSGWTFAPSLTEATMALGVDAEGKPVNPTSTFATDTPEVFCSVLVSNVSQPLEILSEWYYVEGELEGVTDHLIDSHTLTVEVDQYVEFSLSIPDDGWPVGSYELLLYIDGEPELAVPFTVEGSGASETEQLSEVTTARGADSNARPVEPTSTFPAGTTRVYVTFHVGAGVATDTPLLAEWYSVDGDQVALIDSYEMDVTGDSDYSLYYEVSGGWPAGQYAIALYLDDVEQAVVEYSVVQSE